MSQPALAKLKDLRDRLSTTSPYPWAGVREWASAAEPLFVAVFSQHLDGFRQVVKEPKWLMLPRFSSRGSVWDSRPARNNFAEAAATEDRANRETAESAKRSILSFLDTVVDVATMDETEPSKHADGDDDLQSAIEADHVALVDLVAEYYMQEGEPPSLRHVLLSFPADAADHVRAVLGKLQAVGCVEVTGRPSQEVVYLEAKALLLSSHKPQFEATVERLLSFFKDRSEREKGRFQTFKWEELKNEGVVSSDQEFGTIITLLGLLNLRAGGTQSKGPPLSATWDVPRNIVELRTVESLGDLIGLSGRFVAKQEEMTMAQTAQADPRKVFVIHGRNMKAKQEMGTFIRSLGLTPLNFDDLRARMGGTPMVADIVEKGMEEAQGIIALITADEYSAVRPDYRYKHDKAEHICRWQARPNVIFEAGMAFGKDRNRVVFVLLGSPELFTDVAGVHVLRPTNDPSGDRATLRTALKSMGCTIEDDTRDWMKAGDFESTANPLPGVSPRDPFSE